MRLMLSVNSLSSAAASRHDIFFGLNQIPFRILVMHSCGNFLVPMDMRHPFSIAPLLIGCSLPSAGILLPLHYTIRGVLCPRWPSYLGGTRALAGTNGLGQQTGCGKI